MTQIERAIAWMLDHHQEGHLNGADIIRIMEEEFMDIRRPNEYLLSDYGVIELMESFGIHDTTLFEHCIAVSCGAQCLCGPEIEVMVRQAAQQYREQQQFGMADLTEWYCGGIFLYMATVLLICQIYFPDGVHESDVRRFVRLLVGHERQHALQSMSFIMEGRQHALQSMSFIMEGRELVHPGTDSLSEELDMQYAALPSEMEADAVGFQLMLDYEG